ncbi:hypothetical protein [Rhizobium sp. LC145]|uniref:hypothetical protein n=1 Tax=Rhizobium sp. LC145 TaxID=1120688 RepID=UPI00062A0992|nr:hypothetical protein [Rhizobium sp. LC145]KKX25335.1 hypothetical protein YH62_25675 [Rhizobium sp. LC145]TKT45360.1 hypothetical protein FDR95_25840 [Rhizobiaceae bacterium LC148]
MAELTTVNIKNVVQGMERINDVLPDVNADAMAALTFVLVETAVETGVSLDDVKANLEIAWRSRSEAARQVMS